MNDIVAMLDTMETLLKDIREEVDVLAPVIKILQDILGPGRDPKVVDFRPTRIDRMHP